MSVFPMADELACGEVLAAFCTDPSTCAVTPLGSGNINDTYLVRSAGRSFVLQKINSEVFPEPLRVIENFYTITTHLTRKKGDVEGLLQTAHPVRTLKKKPYYRDSRGGWWRGQTYLPHRDCRMLSDLNQAWLVGEALAVFHGFVGDLDLQSLSDPLPGFHNLPCYLAEFDGEARHIKSFTDENVRYCLDTVERYRPQAAILEQAKHEGILTLQPIHGDPKIDNFLFDDQGKVFGLLDLDTVTEGLVHYDLGDCLRSCCNRAGEVGGSAVSVSFDMDICRALIDGYFSGPETLFSKKQRSYIFDGVLLICFELGLRFFTDHLRGNPYFKVRQDGENLLRAVNQFRLADDIAAQELEIRAMVLSPGSD